MMAARSFITSTFTPRRSLAIALLLTLAAISALSAPQSGSLPKESSVAPPATSSSRDAGSISGRVVSDEGHPLLNASVFVVPVGVANQANTVRRTTATDEDGNFHVIGLAPGAY